MPGMKLAGWIWTAILGLAAGNSRATPTEGMLLDSYAALVNGKVITVGDVLSSPGFQNARERLTLQYSGRDLAQKVAQQFETTRNALIESELILLDFEMQGGTLPDRAVEDHVNTVIHERFQNDRAAFLNALAAERLTFVQWRRQMKEQLTVKIMQQREVSSRILITPLDLQRAYEARRTAYTLPERVRLRTLALPGGDTAREHEEARARGTTLLERITAGETTLDEAAAGGGRRAACPSPRAG